MANWGGTRWSCGGNYGTGDRHKKDLGYNEYNDYRKKRPAYSTYGMHDINEAFSHGKAGWVDYGAMEVDDQKTMGKHNYEKKTHEKGVN